MASLTGPQSNPVPFEVTAQPLPSPWLNRDIGVPGSIGIVGSATYSSGGFQINAAGQGISYNSSSDAFHFVYQSFTGDGSIIARVNSGSGVPNPKIGVMIRESLDPAAPSASIFFNPSTAAFYYGTSAATGNLQQAITFAYPAYPFWVQLVRSGNTFSASISADGLYWTPIGSQEILTMADNAYVGLAVSSGSTSTSETATIDHVSVDTTNSPAPTISNLSATTGSVGSQFVVYGSGFGSSQGSSQVTLNGATLTVNSWSASAIAVMVPTGAASGLVGVVVAPSMNNSNQVAFTVTSQPLASGWLDTDIGNVGVMGSATYSNGLFSVTAAGQGLADPLDGFHFVFQPLSGDGSIVARVAQIQNGNGACQIGLMIRGSLHPDAAYAFISFYPNSGSFRDRPSTSGTTNLQSTSFSGPTSPYWLKIVRSGSTLSGFVSLDAINWTQVGTSQTVTMPQNVFIGMAASKQSTTSQFTASFDGVSVSTNLLVPPSISRTSATTGSVGSQLTIYGTGFGSSQGSSLVTLNDGPVTINSWSSTAVAITIPSGATSGYLELLLGAINNSSNPVVFEVTTQPLPSGWLDSDIGAVGISGNATYSSSAFTVTGSGQGLSGTADGLHFVYQPLTSNGVVVARVSSITGGTGQLGVMMRETLDTASSVAFVDFVPNSANFLYRAGSGTNLSSQSSTFVNARYPYWVKLSRAGNVFSAFVSSDGSTWTQVGTSETITMAQTIFVGLGVSSQNTATQITAVFDNVAIASGTLPIISSITPLTGATGTSVTVNGASFGSSQGTSSIQFNGSSATSVTSWTSTQIVAVVPPGATSGPVTVTVGSLQSNNNYSFTLIHPVITSVSPPAGGINAQITITGSGFTVGQGAGSQVLFNGVSGGVTTWTDTQITAFVPPGATTGPITVLKSGVASNGVAFIVENLSVTSILPTSAPVGSIIKIYGVGFGATQSTSSVDFFGTVASIQSWSDSEIDAIVPTGVYSGPVDVTVGGILWYGPQFTLSQTVQLADSKSNSTNYTMELIGGQWVTSTTQGSGCSSCTQRGNISFVADANGRPLSQTDENLNSTTYTYDSQGNVLTVTVPISSGNTATTTYTYNSFGSVLTATDPLGNVTTNSYDANNNLLAVTSPAPGNNQPASVTHFAYNSLGELTNITDPRGNQTTMSYFSTGLLQNITDAQGNVTAYAYDSFGNRTSVTDANNKQTTFTYDAMNRLTKITYPDSTTTQFGYDVRGRRTSVTDQNSKQTTYTYDDADRLTTVTDAANNVTTYGYDSESNLTSIKDANLNTTTFDYDAFRRVSETHFPSGKVETYGYDNVGNLTSKTDRKNQLITYTYDQLNRLTQKSYPDTTSVNYTYDSDSRLTQVTDPTGTYSFTFDNMGRLSGTTTQYTFLTGRSFTTAYAYDAASNRTGFTDPENGSSSYAYDTLNRLQTLTPPTAISSGSFGFGYDALSRRTSLTRPNSVNTSYGYDTLSRLLSVTHASGGTTLDGATYTVDNAGNRLTRTPQPTGTASTYGYDNIYELLSVTQSGSTTESYTYDPVGNRLTNLGSAAWSYNTSNELNSRPSYSYTYDFNGSVLTSITGTNTTSYAWDFENRLTTVTLPGSGGTVTFKYDPFGRRIYKSSTSGTSIYAYDADNLIEETNGTGGVVARYTQTQNVDELLAMLRSSTTSYYEADGLGSITSLTNTAGAIASSYTYDSFGNLVASSGSLVNNYRYTAREFDTETNLYFYRARYYDPQVGRFLTEDPSGFQAGSNFYRYVRNRPTAAIDPSGQVDVVPLPDANVHRLGDIDAACGLTAGGCERVGFSPDWTCKKDCDKWKAKVTISLNGDIYVATGPFPYKGRPPADSSVRDTASALRHENLHVSDMVNAILPIYQQFESKSFDSKEDCDQAGVAATAQAVPGWAAAGAASQRRRH
jgi:RHS repeat-associated protein